MSDPRAIIGDIMALMKRGTVTLALNDRAMPPPYVGVTADGKTWLQPIRRALGNTQSSPEEIADALGIAIDRVRTSRAGANADE